MHPTELLRRFNDWEYDTRGLKASSQRVPVEPVFVPLFGSERMARPMLDDGRRPRLLDHKRGQTSETVRLEESSTRSAEPSEDSRELVALSLLLPRDFAVKPGGARSWLASFQSLAHPLSFEIVGVPDRVAVQIVCAATDRASVATATRAHFPEARLRDSGDAVRAAWDKPEGYGVIVALGLNGRVFGQLRSDDRLDIDPLVSIIETLGQLNEGEVGLMQLLIAPARAPWRDEFENFASSIDDVDKVLPMIRAKFAEPLFAAVLRVAAMASDRERTESLARNLAFGVAGALRSEANEIIMAETGDHSFDDELEDLLDRATRRSGMLLSLSEVLTVVHLPSASVRTARLLRLSGRTKSAPALSLGHALCLGTNEHDGEVRRVSLSTEARLRHTYVIGASGTGKSTLLLSMAVQDLRAGNGFAVLDPHGDLIEDILARIPEERINDVVVFDPADEAYPVGFNILSAHSELERTLLSSDLVAVFKRLSTSFGDQMVAVLGNAILAFLESTEGGTLVDLRRFLIDKSFRARFLETVQDEQVVSYWQEEFTFLKGLPHAPILTRLNIFLRSKLIRHMVAQKKDRLNMRAIMDGKRILLAKLSQGGIGEENSHLLGSLIVAKIAQAAMSRQDEAATNRVPFFLYIDEFHHFITPSLSTILASARKYGLGLTLAHQEMRQLKSRSEEVASAVLGNAYTRIVFRVGDQDAKTLADGFSIFEAKDLQNLGIGEAIARIERQDFDFNLRTSPLPEVSAEVGRDRRKAVIDASRTSFATPREKVDAELRAKSVAEHGDEVTEPRTSRRPVSRKGESSAAPVSTPLVERLPGRGGPQHKYLQSLVRKLAEDRGFKVTVEKRVLDGHGHIDVYLERDGLSIGCEISVSTGAEHETQNLSKCLSAGFSHSVLVSPDERTLSQARLLLGQIDEKRVRFLSPDEFISFLDEFETPKPTKEEGLSIRSREGDRETPTEAAASKRMFIAEDAATYLGVARQTLAKLRWSGDSPPYFKVGRRVLYEKDDLDAWISQRKRRSTSDPGNQGQR